MQTSALVRISSDSDRTADMSVIKSNRFEFVINLKTVKALRRQHLCRLLSGVLDSLTPYIRMSSNVTSVSEAQQDFRKLFAAINGSDAKSARHMCKSIVNHPAKGFFGTSYSSVLKSLFILTPHYPTQCSVEQIGGLANSRGDSV
jgi:hypothetical protein